MPNTSHDTSEARKSQNVGEGRERLCVRGAGKAGSVAENHMMKGALAIRLGGNSTLLEFPGRGQDGAA